MNDSKICFFEETTEWGTDYTGAISIRNSEGKPYAVLAVDVDISNIKKLILKRTLLDFFIILLLGTIYIIIFLIWAQKNITKPITLLEKSVVAFAKRSHGQRNTEALQFTAPEINTENEVQSLSSAVTQMTKDMRDYVDGLVNAEKKAAFMSELAKKDALTGIRNKSAYDLEVMHLSASIAGGKEIQFGIAMVDLNYLKKINDTYGHEKGNVAIIKLCNLVCTIFCHSPVFRIGGDEFVVILKGDDAKTAELLEVQFINELKDIEKDPTLAPWEKVSAAIGISFYDPNTDKDVETVFRRADKKMYQNKINMKAQRKD